MQLHGHISDSFETSYNNETSKQRGTRGIREGRGNCIQANSNECDRPAKTDLRLGEHEKLEKSELCHVGNHIKVSRHRMAKLNQMKIDKYKDLMKREVVVDNIKMEIPDEIATEKANK